MIGESISHYRITGKLGEGGMGVVYKARDLHLDRIVALKVLPAGRVADEERLRRFILEAKSASALSHPNIVTIHDIDSDAGVHFIAMEYIAGRTLDKVIGSKGLMIDAALDYACQVSSALAAAHAAGIIHRDLKPANVIVTETGVAKVLDFGLAKLVDDSLGEDAATRTESLTASGMILGTAAYMSPEQAAGRRVDVRTDVFSFGSMCYEAVTGIRAFPGNSTGTTLAAILRDTPKPLRSARPDVPAGLIKVLERCLEKDREARYPSGVELHQDLVAFRNQVVRPRSRLVALLRQPRISIPVLILFLALIAGGAWLGTRAYRARWARSVALPEAARLIENEKFGEAFEVVRQAERYIPANPELKKLQEQCAVPVKMRIEPPDAEALWKSYRAIASPWRRLGQPDMLVPRIYLRWKIARTGYEPQELAGFGWVPLTVTLDRVPIAPGMVHIPAGSFRIRPTDPLTLDEYWLDKYEVTNRQYKAFVDQGGYREGKYWKQEFLDGGKPLSWEAAMTRLRDTTGRPGPATWDLGTYPEGQDEFPVTGVSWYEAAAYADYAGKSLPTVYHWRRACSDRDFAITSFGNYGGKGPEKVGSNPSLSTFGNYDMAGNVKEWCWNETGSLHYLLGGAWNEPSYSFAEPDAQPPFTRSATFGFRCAIYPKPVPAPLLADFSYVPRDYKTEKPASDDIYKVYKNLYAYDRAELAPSIDATDESSRHWRREKVTFNAAYGKERMAAILFLPRNIKPPYQTVLYFPGSNAFMQRTTSDSITGNDLDFIIRSGRALIYPVYKGTYERSGGLSGKPAADSIMWRDLVITCYKDLGRSLDYLETRPDIDLSKLAYYGLSSGGVWGSLYMAVDGRFRTAVFNSGALPFDVYRPEVDPLNFASRVRIPVLMLNGRYDFAFPLQGCQLPLFHLLGTPETDKRLVLFDSAHTIPRLPMIREVLDWLDRYLGPVQ